MLLVDLENGQRIVCGEIEPLLKFLRVSIPWCRIRVGHVIQDGEQPLSSETRFLSILCSQDGMSLEFVFGDIIELSIPIKFVSFVSGKSDLSELVFVPARARVVVTEYPIARL